MDLAEKGNLNSSRIRRLYFGEPVHVPQRPAQIEQEIAEEPDDASLYHIQRTDLGGGGHKATKCSLLKVLEISCRSSLLDGFFIPSSPRMFKLAFLKSVLSGHKRLVRKADLLPVYGYERYNELTQENLLTFACDNIPNTNE